jgi:hypothetical protein
MNAMKESMKLDLRKDPEELEHEADRVRADFEHTLEALEQRFSPGEMLDQVLEVVKRNGGDFAQNLATQVRNNPLPTLLAGAGITWLIASSARAPQARRGGDGTRATLASGFGHHGTGAGMDDRSGEAMGERMASSGEMPATPVGERAASAAASVKEGVSAAGDAARGAAEGVKGAVHGAGDTARRTGSHIAGMSRSGAQGIREGYSYLSQEQPLVLGALAVAVGAAIGALLPASEAEDRLMGEASDDATQRIREEGRRQAETLRSTASEAAGSARESMRSQTASSGSATSTNSGGAPATR